MKLKTKKLLTKIATGIFFLFGSIEYAVILPTIWLYISNDPYDAEPYFLGLCLAAFSLTGLLTAPLFGLWYDKTNTTKMMILFCNLWEIGGNFMYFLGVSKYFILASRLVAGVGTGCTSAIFAHIAKTTTEEERTAAITVAMAAREIGLLFGPGLNVFLDGMDFQLGPWHVNKYNAAGIFMVVLWVFIQLVILFMYFDLPPIEEQEKILKAEEQIQTDYLEESSEQSIVGDLPPPISIQSPHLHFSITNTPPHLPTYLSSSWQEPQVMCKSILSRKRGKSMSDSHENESQVNDKTDKTSIHSCPGVYSSLEQENYNSVNCTDEDTAIIQVSSSTEGPQYTGVVSQSEFEEIKKYSETSGSDIYPGKWTFYKEYLREEVIVLLTAQFFFSFNQTGLETMITPLTHKLLDFNGFQNSLLFCAAGVEAIAVYALVHFMSRKVQDRTLLAIGVFLTLISITWTIIFIPDAHEGQPGLFALLTVSVAFDIGGLPFFAAVVVSLYSKIISDRTQGVSQGLRRIVDGTGTILGPLWASGALHILYVNFGVMDGLLGLLALMMLLSWKRLRPPGKFWWIRLEDEEKDEVYQDDNPNVPDTEPLTSK